MTIRKMLFVVLIALLTTSTMAAEGAYNLVGAGLSSVQGQGSTWFGFGVDVGGGFNFNQYLGIEAQISVMGIGTSSNVAVMPIPSITVNGYIPIREGASLFVKFGKSETIVGYSGSDTQAHYSGQANFYGVGVEISSAANTDTYRIGVDYYDLGATPGSPLSAYFLNLSSTTHF